MMRKKYWTSTAAILLAAVWAVSANAHFGMIIPSDNMIMQNDPRVVTLTASFSHPMEMIGMEMAKPKVFKVIAQGRHHDLKEQLTPTKVMSHSAWHLAYRIKRPGAYIFFMEPEPYWEPAEDRFIVHITKTVMAAFGDDEGWDAEAGLKTEIIPMTKPFGLYAGNVFQGIVKLNGQPVPYAQVEVEYYNQDKKAQAPADYMVTQTIKADANGLFTYGVPQGGWWGFAALNPADFKLKHNGQDKDVELGAVLWVHFESWQRKP